MRLCKALLQGFCYLHALVRGSLLLVKLAADRVQVVASCGYSLSCRNLCALHSAFVCLAFGCKGHFSTVEMLTFFFTRAKIVLAVLVGAPCFLVLLVGAPFFFVACCSRIFLSSAAWIVYSVAPITHVYCWVCADVSSGRRGSWFDSKT
jgi:hypothetical protein